MIVYVCYTVDGSSVKSLGDRLLASSIDKVFENKANAMEYVTIQRNSGNNVWFIEKIVEDRQTKGFSEAKKQMVLDALKESDYNYRKAAKKMGVAHSTFHDWCRKYKLLKRGRGS